MSNLNLGGCHITTNQTSGRGKPETGSETQEFVKSTGTGPDREKDIGN